MSTPSVIFASDSAWRLGTRCDGGTSCRPLALNGEASPSAWAQAARAALTEAGGSPGQALLALPSSWCLTATINTEDLERGNRRRAMGFRLEEHLPISAEQVVADFIAYTKDEALGVAIDHDRVEPIVAALEAAGFDVRHICPAAMLAAAAATERDPALSAAVIAYRHDGTTTYDLVELDRGKPVRWWWSAEDADDIANHLRQIPSRAASPAVAFIGPSEARQAVVPDAVDVAWQTVKLDDADHAATDMGLKTLAEQAPPLVDLRVDRLAAANRYEIYRRPLLFAAAAVALLIVSVCFAAQWRGRAYQQIERGLAQKQVDIFNATMPNQRVPRGGIIKRRLVSEQRKFADLSGQVADGQPDELLLRADALTDLYRVLSALPKDLRFRILDLGVEPDLVRLDGQALSHGEAERIATALRQTGRYDVEPPKTQALKEGGVSFIFTARPRAAASDLAAGGAP
jgi:hypothetical protein